MVLALLILVSLLVSIPAFPATYVVDPTGNDANAGNASAPWQTIQHAAAQLNPGDTVIIRPGTYVESIWLNESGTEDEPIVVAGEPGAVLMSPNPSASLEAINVASGVGYVTLRGIEATGGFDETIFLRSGAHDIRIEGCNLHHNHAGIIMDSASEVTVDGCSLHDNAALGIRMAGASHDIVVANTDSFNNQTGPDCDAGVDGFAVETGTSAVAFSHVRAYENSGDGFDLQGDDVVLDDVESVRNACSGVKIWGNASVRNCLVYGNARGFGVTSLSGGTLVDISNCTVADNDGVGLDLNNPAVAGTRYAVELHNNIVAGEYKAIQYGKALGISESYNIFFRADPYEAVLAPFRGRRYSGHDINIGRWVRHTHGSEGTLAVDPLFVDAAHGDFHVDPTSAAVGRGQGGSAAIPMNLGFYQQPAGSTNHRPWADAGVDRRRRAGRKLRVRAAGSLDPDGDALTYSWDFGDGSAAVSGFRAKHAYATPGVYPITLTVSDGALSASATIHATIR